MGADLTLRLDSLPVRRNEDRGHHAERAVALSDGVRLDVAVVVLAGPDEAAARFETLSDHVVDQTVLVPDAVLLEFGFVAAVGHNVTLDTCVTMQQNVSQLFTLSRRSLGRCP